VVVQTPQRMDAEVAAARTRADRPPGEMMEEERRDGDGVEVVGRMHTGYKGMRSRRVAAMVVAVVFDGGVAGAVDVAIEG